MKTIFTSNLIKFAISALILSFAFRYFLSISLQNHSTSVIITVAISYAIGMFICGWVFGKKEFEYLPIQDIGFRFHLTTFLSHNLIAYLWLYINKSLPKESFKSVASTAIIWGVFLLIHFFLYLWVKKSSIKNLNKEDLFE